MLAIPKHHPTPHPHNLVRAKPPGVHNALLLFVRILFHYSLLLTQCSYGLRIGRDIWGTITLSYFALESQAGSTVNGLLGGAGGKGCVYVRVSASE